MIEVEIRVYAELNDFLPLTGRRKSFTRRIRFPTSVKDLLEGAGIPHTEIAGVLIDGEPSGFESLLERNCRVAAYPRFRNLDMSGLPGLQPDPGDARGFVADVHLGRLARLLRLLGFDTRYDSAADDESLVRTSVEGQRILVTRDRELLMRAAVTRGYFIRSDDPWKQLGEVVGRFDLAGSARPFTRCLNCNGVLRPVDKSAIEDRLELGTRRYFDRFWECPDCGNLYWRGSHYQRLIELLAEMGISAPAE